MHALSETAKHYAMALAMAALGLTAPGAGAAHTIPPLALDWYAHTSPRGGDASFGYTTQHPRTGNRCLEFTGTGKRTRLFKLTARMAHRHMSGEVEAWMWDDGRVDGASFLEATLDHWGIGLDTAVDRRHYTVVMNAETRATEVQRIRGWVGFRIAIGPEAVTFAASTDNGASWQAVHTDRSGSWKHVDRVQMTKRGDQPSHWDDVVLRDVDGRVMHCDTFDPDDALPWSVPAPFRLRLRSWPTATGKWLLATLDPAEVRRRWMLSAEPDLGSLSLTAADGTPRDAWIYGDGTVAYRSTGAGPDNACLYFGLSGQGLRGTARPADIRRVCTLLAGKGLQPTSELKARIVDWDGDGRRDAVGIHPYPEDDANSHVYQLSERPEGAILHSPSGIEDTPHTRNVVLLSSVSGRPTAMFGRAGPNFVMLDRRDDEHVRVWQVPAGRVTRLGDRIPLRTYAFAVDWDGDGDTDVIAYERNDRRYYPPHTAGWVGIGKGYDQLGRWLGRFDIGGAYLLQNRGDDASPRFADPQQLVADGRPVDGHPFGCADWDDDGDLDLFVAPWPDTGHLLRNVGTRQHPVLHHDDSVLATPVADRRAVPTWQAEPCDWDGDGDLDLLLGSRWLRNDGTRQAPSFTLCLTSEQDAALSVESFSVPAVADMDRDGDLDLFSGSEPGYVRYWENTGTRARPFWTFPRDVMAGGRQLWVDGRQALQGPLERWHGYPCPVVTDWDGDGRADLIAGDVRGHHLWYRNAGIDDGWELAGGIPLRVHGRPLVTRWRVRGTPVHWRGNPTPDWLCLDDRGFLCLFGRQTGGSHVDLAPPERLLDEAGYPIKLDDEGRHEGRVKLAVCDWDGDGDADILAGQMWAKLRALENVGPPDAPRFRLGWIKLPGTFGRHSVAPCPVDWDGDGALDLLVGRDNGRLFLCRPVPYVQAMTQPVYVHLEERPQATPTP